MMFGFCRTALRAIVTNDISKGDSALEVLMERNNINTKNRAAIDDTSNDSDNVIYIYIYIFIYTLMASNASIYHYLWVYL